MAKWVDIRLHAQDAGRAVSLIGQALHPVTMTVDSSPSSGAPDGFEWQISVQDASQTGLRGLLFGGRIHPLAMRARLDDGLTIPADADWEAAAR